MKVLGLDIGSKRIGVAISDALGVIAQSLLVLDRKEDEKTLKDLERIVLEKEVKEIVVGLPLNMDASHGPQAKGAAAFADILREKLNIPVTLWDERMSTMEVERVMIQGGASRAKRKQKIDKLAAQIILQNYLDAHRNK